MTLEVVMLMVPTVRPWKPPWKTMTSGRLVCARAIFTAFSTPSAPVDTNMNESYDDGVGCVGWWRSVNEPMNLSIYLLSIYSSIHLSIYLSMTQEPW
jgi:hypothetical protein